MSLNRELLAKVRDSLLDASNPVGFDMNEWLAWGPGAAWDEKYSEDTLEECGTVACICGHALVLSTSKPLGQHISSGDSGRLGLKALGAEEFFWLFFRDQWPAPLEQAYDDCTSTAHRALVAADAIDLCLGLDDPTSRPQAVTAALRLWPNGWTNLRNT